MKKINLSKWYQAIVDDDSYHELNKYKWYYAHWYAVRTVYDSWKPKQLRMHRLIIDTPEWFDTDHINRNRLDNRKCNLRIATRSQNVANSFVVKQNKSWFKWVSWKASNKKWCAQIRVRNKVIHIWLFINIQDAAKAYNNVAKKQFGEFAVLNKVYE